jgi:hypothetical protein
MNRTAIAALTTIPALAIGLAAVPAEAISSSARLVNVSTVGKVQNGGSLIGLGVTYICDPTAVSMSVGVQASQGSHWAMTSFQPQLCTGKPQTSRIKIDKDGAGVPGSQVTWQPGRIIVLARVDTVYDVTGDPEVEGPWTNWVVRLVRGAA